MRILIVRTSALGDVVHCLPVLVELRKRLPAARIGWVVEGAMAPLLEGHPDLDRLLVVRLRDWRRRPLAAETLRQTARFLTELTEFAPDVTLDLMGNHKAALIAAASLADRRAGLARPYRREPASAAWINRPVVPRGVHAVDRALAVVGELGIEPGEPDFGGAKLFPGAPAEVGGRRPAAEGPYLLIHPGAGWGNKRYPPERWGEAGRLAAERTALPLWVASGPGEEALARSVAEHAGGRAVAVDAPTLPELATLLRGAALVMAGDTGPLHLAHAMGVPVLCLMGPTDPERSGPYGAPDAAVAVRLPCSFCYRRYDGVKACLLEIPPARVAELAAAAVAGA